MPSHLRDHLGYIGSAMLMSEPDAPGRACAKHDQQPRKANLKAKRACTEELGKFDHQDSLMKRHEGVMVVIGDGKVN